MLFFLLVGLLGLAHADKLLHVRCQSPENCLQLNIPHGFDSAFWKSMGYKYNTTEHPECEYIECDRAVYPHESSTTHDVSGYKGVDLVKYGKPPVSASTTNTTTYTCGTCNHVYNAAADGGGVPFEQLPDSWTCPVCGSPKSAYKPSTDSNGHVIWIEEHEADDDDSHNTEAITTVLAAKTTATAPSILHPCKNDADCKNLCTYCQNGVNCHAPADNCCLVDADCPGSYCINTAGHPQPWKCHGKMEQVENKMTVPSIVLSNGVSMPAIAAGTWEYDQNTAQAAIEAGTFSSPSLLFFLVFFILFFSHQCTAPLMLVFCVLLLHPALQAGFTHIDTAHDYCGDGSTGDCKSKSNQLGIKLAIQKQDRSKLFITTKVPGCGLQGISRANCGPDSVKAALDNLVELGVDYTDLLLVHFPPPLGCGALNCGIIQQQWKSLSEEILKTNKTRALGVSNFCISCFKCLLGDGDEAKEGTSRRVVVLYCVASMVR